MKFISKEIFLILILSFFQSCKNEKKINHIYNDSIVFYNKEIKTSNYPDSIKKILTDKVLRLNYFNKNDSIRIKNNDTIAYNYYKLNYSNDYKKVAKQNLIESIKIKDTARIIKSTINYGHFFLRNSIQDSAYFYFDKAQKLYVLNNQIFESNELAVEKASIQYYNGDYLGSETTILKSLSFLKKINDKLKLNVAYSIVGLCKLEIKEYEDAIYYLELALKLANTINDEDISKGIALNNLGLVHFKKKDYKKAIENYEKAINIKDFKKNNLQIYTYAKQNLVLSRFYNGGENNVEDEFKEIITNYNKLNLSLALPKIQLSEYCLNQNEIKKSRDYAIEAYNISTKKNAFRDKLIALKQLTNVFPENATFYSNEYIKLSDSIAAVDKKTQNTFARIEYRVDELNSENLLLAERNKKIIYYSVIGLLVLSMFYFYRWQKQKQKELLLIQEQQKANEEVYRLMINQQSKMDKVKAKEQKRISRELHDGILGKLFGARMNLDYLNSNESEEIKQNKKIYIQEIIDVEKQIRQISHELNDEKRAIINNYQLMIDRLVEKKENLLGIKIDYSCDTKIPWEKLNAEEKINLYRIFQESFHNINKYANAKNIIFSIQYDDKQIVVQIIDNGDGFDLKRAAKGIGIKNMRERAKLIKALYTIESEINKGTKTQIILEINPNKDL